MMQKHLRKPPEMFDPNQRFVSIFSTSDIQSTSTTFSDNIPVPLIPTRVEDYQANANDQDDDIIGEEVRPLPIDSSVDSRTRALQAFLQDHTYVQNTVCRCWTRSFFDLGHCRQTINIFLLFLR